MNSLKLIATLCVLATLAGLTSACSSMSEFLLPTPTAELTESASGGDSLNSTPIPVPSPSQPSFLNQASLDGPADDLANEHIPETTIPDIDATDYVIFHNAIAISFRKLLLVFSSDTTVQEANELLDSIDATIVGSLPQSSLLFLRVELSDLNEMMALLSLLNSDSRVEIALMEMGSTPDALPNDNVSPNWTWEVPVYPDGPFLTGNWGLKMIRAPQMWNLDSFVRRHRNDSEVSVGIFDSGFDSSHPDLTKLDVPNDMPIDNHGTIIAEIIGASWDNGQGVEGINPWIHRMYGREKVFRTNISVWDQQLIELVDLLEDNSDVKAVNNSYGLNSIFALFSINPTVTLYGDITGSGIVNFGADLNGDGLPDGVDVDTDGKPDTWAQVIDFYGNLYSIVLSPFCDDIFFVASAGNGGPAYSARTNSPLANAAARFQGCYLAVENIDRSNAPGTGSNLNGSISAPGTEIQSTISSGVAITTGTSFAAPYVTGLIAALWVLDPALTVDEIRTLVTDPQFTVETQGKTQPHIDAFAAAMGIDTIQKNRDLQRALIDVDDNTLDGNFRVDPATGESIDGIASADGIRGDGTINMRDFRTFRDAFLQILVEGAALAADDVSLDGATDHPKKDLNLNGQVDDAENVFPRYDFNGSGDIEITGGLTSPGSLGLMPFKVDPDRECPSAGCRRDIDVLADPSDWQVDSEQVISEEQLSLGMGEGLLTPHPFDPSGTWQPIRNLLFDRDGDAMIDYLLSADFHFVLAPMTHPDVDSVTILVASELPTGASAVNGNCPQWDEIEPAWRRCITVPSTMFPSEFVVTIPMWTNRVGVVVHYHIKNKFDFVALNRDVNNPFEVKLGQDTFIAISPSPEEIDAAINPPGQARPLINCEWQDFVVDKSAHPWKVDTTLAIANVSNMTTDSCELEARVFIKPLTNPSLTVPFTFPDLAPGNMASSDINFTLPTEISNDSTWGVRVRSTGPGCKLNISGSIMCERQFGPE